MRVEIKKIDRKSKDINCIICKKNVRRGVVFRIFPDYFNYCEELIFHNACFLALAKKLFPKDVRISKRMKNRAIANMI